jgi:nitroreductase
MLIDLLRRRWSVREFRDQPIPEPVLQDILEAGRLSPSGGNEQAWRFGVLTDRELITQVAALAYGQTWLARAPLLIVLCTVGVDDARGGRGIQADRFPDYADRLRQLDQNLYWALNQEEHQTKIAGAHMALAAWEQGVGSCWVSRFQVMPLAQLLGLPPGCLPSEILVLGYPARERKAAAKKALADLVFYNLYRPPET